MLDDRPDKEAVGSGGEPLSVKDIRQISATSIVSLKSC